MLIESDGLKQGCWEIFNRKLLCSEADQYTCVNINIYCILYI